jgi:hypothetical protein
VRERAPVPRAVRAVERASALKRSALIHHIAYYITTYISKYQVLPPFDERPTAHLEGRIG